MEMIKTIMSVVAMLLPVAVCVLLGWRMIKNRNTDWKLATCLSGSAVAAALVLLLGSERVLFLKYGDAVLQVNAKAEEIRNLTEQNKRIAIMTAKAIVTGLNGTLADESRSDVTFRKAVEDLLKEAGASSGETRQILDQTNSTPRRL